MPSRVMRTASLVPLVSLHLDEVVALLDADGDDAALAAVGEILQRGFLHRALLRGEEDVAARVPGDVVALRVLLRLDADERGDFLARLHLEQIGDGAALGGAAHVGNLVHPLDVDAAACW